MEEIESYLKMTGVASIIGDVTVLYNLDCSVSVALEQLLGSLSPHHKVALLANSSKQVDNVRMTGLEFFILPG